MLEECAPAIPVSRLLGWSGFGNAVGSVEASASDDIQEIKFLGSCLMLNNAAVCCGRIWLKCFVSVWSDLWKSLERESAMMFSVPLMCCGRGMSRDWRVSIHSSVRLYHGILHSLDLRMLCASIPVRLDYLWIPGYVNPIPIEGWLCIWSLLTPGILGGSTWVSHAMLQVFSIAMLGHFHCIPLCHIHRCRTIALLMVRQKLCCWLRPLW